MPNQIYLGPHISLNPRACKPCSPGAIISARSADRSQQQMHEGALVLRIVTSKPQRQKLMCQQLFNCTLLRALTTVYLFSFLPMSAHQILRIYSSHYILPRTQFVSWKLKAARERLYTNLSCSTPLFNWLHI